MSSDTHGKKGNRFILLPLLLIFGDLPVKKGIHPEYRPVVFMDPSAKFSFVTRSTVKTNETITWEDGNEYPLVKVDVSSASHPFYTGKMKYVDSTGRLERFRKKFGDKYKKKGKK